ncbi:MAG: zinc metallopeptidase [Candidatus Limisoma sp.]
MYFILFIGIAIASYVVQASLNSKFKKYSRIPTDSGLTGAEVAERMLREHGINDVKVTQISGSLTDHYNPATHTVNLSREVYYGNSVASAAVAAHECGHALQHATRYSMLQLRSALVPAVSLSSQIMPWILLAGILTITIFPAVMLLGIILFALTTLFSFVTLPVEINASRRAIAWLNNTGITRGQNTYFAQDALKSAAYTYVVAALSSLATLIYCVMIFMGRRD